MAFDRRSLDDYVPVNERIALFYERYPLGSIQAEVLQLTDNHIVMKAYAFREPGDPNPGIGHSMMQIPGLTPYTKGSEIENAETSAWGRALAALGFEVKRGIASREEIENKADGGRKPEAKGAGAQGAPAKREKYESPNKATDEEVATFWAACVTAFGGDKVEAQTWLKGVFKAQEPPITKGWAEVLKPHLILWSKQLAEYTAGNDMGFKAAGEESQEHGSSS